MSNNFECSLDFRFLLLQLSKAKDFEGMEEFKVWIFLSVIFTKNWQERQAALLFNGLFYTIQNNLDNLDLEKLTIHEEKVPISFDLSTIANSITNILYECEFRICRKNSILNWHRNSNSLFCVSFDAYINSLLNYFNLERSFPINF